MEMKFKFTLEMKNLVIKMGKDEKQIVDEMTIEWITDTTRKKVMAISNEYVTDKNFLTDGRTMTGLVKVGESHLSIEPVEED